jgi:hypothetical protein
MERSGSRISRVAPKNNEPAERGDERDSLRLYTNLFPIFFTGANLPRIFLNYVLQEKHPIIKGFGANSSLGI